MKYKVNDRLEFVYSPLGNDKFEVLKQRNKEVVIIEGFQEYNALYPYIVRFPDGSVFSGIREDELRDMGINIKGVK